MPFVSKPRLTALATQLVASRRMCSLIEQELALVSGAIQQRRINGRLVLCDLGNQVRSDCGTKTALRAIGVDGKTGWYVGNRMVQCDDPFEAFETARDQLDPAPATRASVLSHLAWRRIAQKTPFFSAA